MHIEQSILIWRSSVSKSTEDAMMKMSRCLCIRPFRVSFADQSILFFCFLVLFSVTDDWMDRNDICLRDWRRRYINVITLSPVKMRKKWKWHLYWDENEVYAPGNCEAGRVMINSFLVPLVRCVFLVCWTRCVCVPGVCLTWGNSFLSTVCHFHAIKF